MRLTALLTLLPLLVSVSMVRCSIQVERLEVEQVMVIAVDTEGNMIKTLKTDPRTPRSISSNVRSVILGELLGVPDPNKFPKKRISYAGFRPAEYWIQWGSLQYTYFQLIVIYKDMDAAEYADAPCRPGGRECFGFISRGDAGYAQVGLFEKLEAPLRSYDGSKCPFEMLIYKQESGAPAGQWLSLAMKMWKEFTPVSELSEWPKNNLAQKPDTVDPGKAAALEHARKLFELTFADHGMMLSKKDKQNAIGQTLGIWPAAKPRKAAANPRKTGAVVDGRVTKPKYILPKPRKPQSKRRLEPGANY